MVTVECPDFFGYTGYSWTHQGEVSLQAPAMKVCVNTMTPVIIQEKNFVSVLHSKPDHIQSLPFYECLETMRLFLFCKSFVDLFMMLVMVVDPVFQVLM